MKRLLHVLFILFLFFSFSTDCLAKDRVVKNIGKSEIFSEGLYFKISEINTAPSTTEVLVRVKNKSMLSQAVYIELEDETNTYKPVKSGSIKIFNPLKFNKPISEKLVFKTNGLEKNCKLVLYSRDIFKKNKKKVITKIDLNEAKEEIISGKTKTSF